MKTSEFLSLLRSHPDHLLHFALPDGGWIPVHAHITEVGRVDKTFLDCGGTVRKTSFLCLQSWVADDVEHRLPSEKLAQIIDRAAPLFFGEDLNVELEYEDGLISQFPVLEAQTLDETIVFTLGLKHTDCLAKEICLPPAKETDSSCCSGSGCC